MDDFFRGQQPFEQCLSSFGVGIGEVPPELVEGLTRRDLSFECLSAWRELAELFGRSRRLTPALCWILSQDDHEMHEDLADALQNLADPRSVDCLHDRAIRDLPYLEYNDGSALTIRCLWALHDIGTPEAIAKLELLLDDPREDVAEKAAERLSAFRQRKPHSPAPAYRLAREGNLGPL